MSEHCQYGESLFPQQPRQHAQHQLFSLSPVQYITLQTPQQVCLRFKQNSHKCFARLVSAAATTTTPNILPHRLPSCSMSDDEQESGCDTVDSSPASDASSHSNSCFTEQRYIANGNQNCEPRVACVAPETEPSKPTVRTVVVPPMRVQNNNNNHAISETHGNTGKTGHI